MKVEGNTMGRNKKKQNFDYKKKHYPELSGGFAHTFMNRSLSNVEIGSVIYDKHKRKNRVVFRQDLELVCFRIPNGGLFAYNRADSINELVDSIDTKEVRVLIRQYIYLVDEELYKVDYWDPKVEPIIGYTPLKLNGVEQTDDADPAFDMWSWQEVEDYWERRSRSGCQHSFGHLEVLDKKYNDDVIDLEVQIDINDFMEV